jgi:DNA topoisomerase-6 subunit A
MTKRDVFYDNTFTIPGTNKKTFESQFESDKIIEDIEVITGILREDMGIVADPKGVIAGPIKIKSENDIIDCAAQGSGAWSIPSSVSNIEFVHCDASFVLVVEKGAIFTRLNAMKFWRKHNCLLVSGGGQPDRGTRRLVKRLAEELNLPVLMLCDADPYGFYIASVYKYGSANLAFEAEKLACPKAEFIGVRISDIFKYKLEKWSITAKDEDIKRAKELLSSSNKYPWFQSEFWQNELKLFLAKKLKCEIETLSRYGLGYKFLSEEYLPERIKEFIKR